MTFITKLDTSDNRQIKQDVLTSTHYSGTNVFGTAFADLPAGPDPATTGVTTSGFVSSTFTGVTTGTTSTTFFFGDPDMNIAIDYMTIITSANTGTTQVIPQVFVGTTSVTVGDNTPYTAYSGVSFNFTVGSATTPTAGTISGVASSTLVKYSADSLDYTGDTNWVQVPGIMEAYRLRVTSGVTVGFVLTAVDSSGNTEWQSVSGSSLWSASTGTNAIVPINQTGVASGPNSIAINDGTASGSYSFASGLNTIAAGNKGSHAEGQTTVANGTASHAEGNATTTNSDFAHAEGTNTIANGTASHAEGNTTIANANYSHAEGELTIASGVSSHAQGIHTMSLGDYSHTGGEGSSASIRILAGGDASFNHSFIDASNLSGANANYSAILGGKNHSILGSASSSFILGGDVNLVKTGVINSGILGGGNITATTSNMVYVPSLHNTSPVMGGIKMSGNSTNTVISTINEWTKTSGTTSLMSESNKFSMPINGQLRYDGLDSFIGVITITFDAERVSGTTNLFEFSIFKNGLPIPDIVESHDSSTESKSVVFQTMVTLNTNDTIELYTRNIVDTDDILIKNSQIIIR